MGQKSPNSFPSSARPLIISEPQGLGFQTPIQWDLGTRDQTPIWPGPIHSLHISVAPHSDLGPWYRAEAGSILLKAQTFKPAIACVSTYSLGPLQSTIACS